MAIADYQKFSESIFMETIILVISQWKFRNSYSRNKLGRHIYMCVYICLILGRVDLNYLALLFLYPVKFNYCTRYYQCLEKFEYWCPTFLFLVLPVSFFSLSSLSFILFHQLTRKLQGELALSHKSIFFLRFFFLLLI